MELSIPEYVRNNTQTRSTGKPNRNLTRGEPLEDKCKGVTFSWIFNVTEPSSSGRFSYFDRSGGTHREYVVQPSSQEAQDLKSFMASKKFFSRVGRAWKRRYILYGPPGTGKSSLIAAIANYTQYDVYDMKLTEREREDHHLHDEPQRGFGSRTAEVGQDGPPHFHGFEAFKVLACKVSQFEEKFGEIEELIVKVDITPADITEVLIQRRGDSLKKVIEAL
ncbi:hypothetical protein SELMODRAFT_422466 [Selaginella moellendorffii]|uniref:Uncharacterized protein n=1 Tax=Selaginella moellendorffii TaxID=88036 RepID=D8SIH2_SELML|nr:hypothetical protein SELMODRAFT_422466 [Selaginella moellendorffii]